MSYGRCSCAVVGRVGVGSAAAQADVVAVCISEHGDAADGVSVGERTQVAPSCSARSSAVSTSSTPAGPSVTFTVLGYVAESPPCAVAGRALSGRARDPIATV